MVNRLHNLRVVLLTRWSPWQIQAANRLHERLGLSAVVVETYGPIDDTIDPSLFLRFGRALKRLRRVWTSKLTTIASHLGLPGRTPDSSQAPGAEQLYQDFGHQSYTRLNVGSEATYFTGPKGITPSLVSELRPDIILVYGTSIVSEEVISSARYVALNLHWGLSPWYRGTHCTDWALLNGDLSNIGVTVHLLEPGIDSGPIVSQGKPVLDTRDSPFSIDMKLGSLGVEHLIDAVEQLARGRAIVVRPQVRNIGRLYFMKQWNHEATTRLRSALDHGNISRIIANPDRPISLPVRIVQADSVIASPSEYPVINEEPYPNTAELETAP